MNGLRLAARQLVRYPGFSAVVIATLALGIGASTLIFSVVNGVLLKPLPYPNPDRIVRVLQVNENGFVGDNLSEPNFRELKENTRGFSALARYAVGVQPVSGGNEPTRAWTASVSGEFFDVVGIQPLVGRTFVRDELDVGAAPAAVISYSYWQRYFGGDAELGARTLKIADRTYSIVGVMPADFSYPDGAEIWTPAELWPLGESRTAHNWRAVGRLADGVSLAQARADVSAIARRLKADYGADSWMVDAAVDPLRDVVVRAARPALLVLLAAVGLLFAVAVANAANLVLARAVSRDQEFGVRAALGAGRRRLASQFFAEMLLLCGAGGALGVAFAAWGNGALVRLAADRLPRVDAVAIDWIVVAFACGLAVATAVGLSLLVAWRAGSAGVVLRYNQRTSSGTPHAPLSGSLVVAQVALALLLVVGAALLGRSFVALTNVDPGFRTDGFVFMDVSAAWPGDRTQLEPFVPLYDELIQHLRAVPGVDAVAGISLHPGAGGGWDGTPITQNSPDEFKSAEDLAAAFSDPSRTARRTEYRLASEDYFTTVGIPLLRGRVFERGDGPDAQHVAVVSRSLAERLWHGQDPLGKLVQFDMGGELTPSTVVGIVADTRDLSLDRDPRPTFYAPYRQRPWSLTIFEIVIRTTDAARVVPAARDIVQRMNVGVVPQFSTSEQAYSAQLAPRRFNLVLIGVFGGAALLLALAGIYGSIAFHVARRTHEIGVRIALGARPAAVISIVVRRSLLLAGIGVAVGLAIALGAARLASSLLYGIAPHDPVSYAAAAAVLLLAAVGAGLIPALRAARVDPVTALRSE
ncbi:MAG TPA: ADOP family duplicated permease [Gammaproteobacteria bacterium]|nr:ADOP family duplicated permease [Gammaproteobacteria bacterium]